MARIFLVGKTNGFHAPRQAPAPPATLQGSVATVPVTKVSGAFAGSAVASIGGTHTVNRPVSGVSGALAHPSGAYPWPANAAAVGYTVSLVSPPTSGTGWSRSGGRITTTANNFLISGYNLSGIDILVLHDTGIIEQCGWPVGVQGAGSNAAPIQINNSAGGGIIRNCTIRNGYTLISGERTGSPGGFNPGPDWEIHHVLLEDAMENAINPGDSWDIHDFVVRFFGRTDAAQPPHYDGVEDFGGHNNIDVHNGVILLNSCGTGSNGSGGFIGARGAWLDSTGALNFVGTASGIRAWDLLIGGGSAGIILGTSGADNLTNLAFGYDRSGVQKPIYAIRNSGAEFIRDDPNAFGATPPNWSMKVAEDNMTDLNTFNPTLTNDTVGTPF